MCPMSTGETWASLFQAARGAAEVLTPDRFAADVLPHLARAFDTSIIAWYRLRSDGMDGWVPPGLPDPFGSYSRYASSDPYQEYKRRVNPRLVIISDAV